MRIISTESGYFHKMGIRPTFCGYFYWYLQLGGNYFCSGSLHVAWSNEPHLERFFILIWREHKHMLRVFFCTVSPWSLFWHCQPSIAEYITWLMSCSDWQLFCCLVCWWCQGYVRKNANEIPVEGKLLTIFAGSASISGLKGRRVSDSLQQKRIPENLQQEVEGVAESGIVPNRHVLVSIFGQ